MPWDLRGRGRRDTARHDKHVKDAIKKNLRDLISTENIITTDGKRKIKIPVRYINEHRFRYGKNQSGDQLGQGDGQVGDVVAEDENGKAKPNKPGDEVGEELYDAEVEIEEVIRLMLQDLNLPWLERKDHHKLKNEEIQFEDIRKKGPIGNLDLKRTVIENLKRNAAEKGEAVFGDFEQEDMRFKTWEIKEEWLSNACVYLAMDRSGSMDSDKIYVAKSFFFWMTNFIRTKYKHVTVKFIGHDAEARFMTEEQFFSTASSGGTKCSTAYQLALEDIEAHHPPSRWNNYYFHFSDGDNWGDDNELVCQLVNQLLAVCSSVGYGEIHLHDSFFDNYTDPEDSLYSTLHDKLKHNIKHPHFLTARLNRKDDVYKVLEQFLRINVGVAK